MAKLSELGETEQAALRAWYARIGTGFKVWSKEKKSMVGRITASKQWETRRKLYGPTGMRPMNKALRRKLAEVGMEDNGKSVKGGEKC